MADKSAIEWTDATWNPIVGCSIISPGCTNCYAMKVAARVESCFKGTTGAPHYRGLTKPSKAGPVWAGKVALAPEAKLTEPLRWRKPRKVFVNSEGDLFHETIPDEWIDKVFAVMALCPQHTFQVLTKRAERMRAYLDDRTDKGEGHLRRWAASFEPGTLPITQNDVERRLGILPKFSYDQATPAFPLPNVWLGVSTERQQEADERIPLLLQTPAAVRFISAEPLLGPIRLDMLNREPDDYDRKMPGFATVEKFYLDALNGADGIQWKDGHAERATGGWDTRLDWVIVGGESGPNARPMHPQWARDLRDQCAEAGVPFFFKQWGEWLAGEANRGQFAARPMHGYRRCDNHSYEWPHGNHLVDNFGSHPDRFSGEWRAQKVGKRKAGRLLDGKEHNEFPIVREVKVA